MRGRRGEGVAGVDGFGRRSSAGCGGVGDAGVRTGASRPDSLGWEKEELAADLAVVFDSCGGPRYNGVELDTVAAMEELGRGGRTRRGREKGGEWSAGQVGKLLGWTTMARMEWGGGMGAGEVAAWRQWPCPPLWRRKRKIRKNPLASFKIISKGSLAGFSDLNWAPGHFYKFQKNSHGLDLTFRISTKSLGFN